MSDIMNQILSKSGVTDDEKLGLASSQSSGGNNNDENASSSDQGEEGQQSSSSGEQSNTGQSSAGASGDANNASTKDKQEGAGASSEGGGEQQQQVKAPIPLRDKDGNVVAQGGAERRLFNNYRRIAEKEYPALKSQYEALERAASGYKEYNLKPDEAVASYKLMAAWKADPAKVIQTLLTQARTAGINIEGLGNGVDIAAIKSMISDATKPLREAKETEERAEQAERAAVEEYENFITEFPDATTHEEEIGALLQHNAKLSPREAYLLTRNYYYQQGLDWSLPLAKANAAKAGNKQQQSSQQQQKPLPNSRGAAAENAGGNQNSQEVTQMAPDASWDDIIRTSMKDQGMLKQTG
jgi:hypothetical protein